jgi:hypothetical protein
MSLLDVIKRWVKDQGDEAYQQKRREREARVKEVIIEHEQKRREAKDETKGRDN